MKHGAARANAPVLVDTRTYEHSIIADDGPANAGDDAFPGRRDRAWNWLPICLAVAAVAGGSWAAAYYWHAGLTLSHYDAKAHLVVARRIVDSLTPGWVQVGAVWLPLPHLLNMIPVQVDAFYRTGISAIFISVLSFGVIVYVLTRIVLHITASPLAATLGVMVFALNPDVLYLQSTPMTELLLMALTAAAVWLASEAFHEGRPPYLRRAGLALAAAALTRYEAWPIVVAILGVGCLALFWQGAGLGPALRRTSRLAWYPAAALCGFLLLSRATVGEWFVQGGFFVPDNIAMDRPLRAGVSVWWGLHELTSYPLAVFGAVGLVGAVITAVRHRTRALIVVPLALAAASVLPWYAFYHGHPFRIRYMIPLVPVVALGVGLAIGSSRRWRLPLAAAAVAALALGPRPLDAGAPMVLEAQWDTEHRLGRAQVTAYLVRAWDHQPIMASMGSLAHYMQELSATGFRLADFLHEGNGDIWLAALVYPDPHAAWILVEEQAEGGDMLAALARQRPQFLANYDRVAEGGGVALYRRKLSTRAPGARTDSGSSPGG